MAVRRPLVLVGGDVKELPSADSLPVAAAPITPETLTHTSGAISIDLAGGGRRFMEFVADAYTAGGITLVGVGSSEGGVAIPLPGGMLENDIVIVATATNPTGNLTGYTSIRSLSGGHQPGGRASYKFMGSSPDTSVVLSGTTGVHSAAVYRGVDTTTPLDATAGWAYSRELDEIDPATVTTVTDNALNLILANNRVADDGDATGGSFSGYTLAVEKRHDAGGGYFDHAFIFHKEITTAGAENPAAHSKTFSSGYYGWHVATQPLRPAPESGQKDYTVTFANIPAGEMIPVDAIFETKTDVGSWDLSAVDEWIGGAAPAFGTVGRHHVRFYVKDSLIVAQYVGMLA